MNFLEMLKLDLLLKIIMDMYVINLQEQFLMMLDLKDIFF